MSILIRCKKCKGFYGLEGKCRCGNIDKVKTYYVQYVENGRRKIKFASHSLTEARGIEGKLKYNPVASVKGIIFREYIDNYFIPHFTSKNKSANKSMYMINRLKKGLGERALADIKPLEIERLILAAVEGLSSSSLDNYVSTAHRIFQYAIEIEFLAANPVKIKKSHKEAIRKRFLNQEERSIFLAACRESTTKYLYEMAFISLFAGLRLGEVQKLKRRDIRDGCIYILSDNAKSKKNREIPMIPELAELMKTASFNYSHDIKRSFATALKRAGLEDKDVRFHDLRRTFGSMLAQKGVPIFDISKLMGHSSVQVTAKIYAHLLPDNLRKAVMHLSSFPTP
jgi:integrase